MNMLEAITPEEEVQVAIEIIENIINDEINIVHSTYSGYFLQDNITDLSEYKQKGEIEGIFNWSDL